MKIEQTLLSSLNHVIERFEKNELAYLALTSKIEFPIRDKWAFLLHEKLSPTGIIVAREWKWIDLASSPLTNLWP